MIDFYPTHIEKEDRHFFVQSMEYLDEQEKEEMIQEFIQFDSEQIHKKYRNVVGELEELEDFK